MGQSVSSASGKSDFVEKWMGVPSKSLMPGNKKDPLKAVHEVIRMCEAIQNSSCNSASRRDPELEKYLYRRLEYNGDLNLATRFVTKDQLEQIFKNDPQYCGKSSGRLLPNFGKQWEELAAK